MSMYSSHYKNQHPPTRFWQFPKVLKICLAVLAVAMSLASIHTLDWASYCLHQAGTLICMGFLVWAVKKTDTAHHAITSSAILGATGFLLVHILGAKYLYSYVPYNDWSLAYLHWDINATFGWQRNMYDRLVHFCYGLLLFPLFFDVLKCYFLHSSRRQIMFLVILLNMATSMFYELIEWALAMSMSAEDAENYNGQQGDIWDAHKDMAMALFGAVLAAMLYQFLDKLEKKPFAKTVGKKSKKTPKLKLLK